MIYCFFSAAVKNDLKSADVMQAEDDDDSQEFPLQGKKMPSFRASMFFTFRSFIIHSKCSAEPFPSSSQAE